MSSHLIHRLIHFLPHIRLCITQGLETRFEYLDLQKGPDDAHFYGWLLSVWSNCVQGVISDNGRAVVQTSRRTAEICSQFVHRPHLVGILNGLHNHSQEHSLLLSHRFLCEWQIPGIWGRLWCDQQWVTLATREHCSSMNLTVEGSQEKWCCQGTAL